MCNSLYFPSKNKMRNFWDEIWIFANFSYENWGTDFLTWHMNSVYFRYENLSSDFFLHEIWNFPFQIWKSYLRYASMKYIIPLFPICMWTLSLLHNMCNLLHVTYEYLGLGFPAWNMEFSVLPLSKFEDSLTLWKMALFIFHIWKSRCRFSTWNMKFCTFLALKY